jgi:hypothetical protein
MPQTPKLQPALYGGLFIGVLSALPLLNVCCCLWIIAGGMIAVYLMQQNYPYPITVADGALVGLLAGVFGAVIHTLVSIPIQMALGPTMQRAIQGWIMNSPEIPPETKSMIENMMARNAGFSVVTAVVGMMFGAVVGAVFGLLGGLLGVAVFKKDGPPPPPPGTIDAYPPPPPPPRRWLAPKVPATEGGLRSRPPSAEKLSSQSVQPRALAGTSARAARKLLWRKRLRPCTRNTTGSRKSRSA